MVGMRALPGWLARLLRCVLVGGGFFLAIAVGSTQAQAFSCPDTNGTPGIPSPYYFLTATDCQKDTGVGPPTGLSAVILSDDGPSDSFVQFDNTYAQFTVQSSITTGANCTAGDNNIVVPPNTVDYKVATAATTAATGGIAACTTTITLTSGAIFTFTANYNFPVSPFTATSLTNVSFSPAGSATPTVTSISPSAGTTAGGTNVTISGTNFSTTAANNTVKFGTTTASIVGTPTATSIVATAPVHAAGIVDVTVTVSSVASAISPADQFTY